MKSNPLHSSLAYYNMSPGTRHSSCRYVYYPHFDEHKSDTVSQTSDKEERKQGSETVLFSKNRQKCSKYGSNQVCTNLTSSQDRPIKCSITNITDEKPLRPPRLDWTDYHRLDVIHSFMDNLEYDYPSLCTTGVIGKSREGRDLKILKISNSNATNTSVWIDAGIHAREWIAPATATFVANKIVKNFNDLPENITNKDWFFLPVMNPDGYEFSHTNDRMWRKNRAWYGGRCVGVDLNRNFSHGWGCKGSSSSPINAFYHGPEPFSEPESTAVRDMLTHSDVQFTVYITLHSYGQIILFPFAFQEELCPSYVRLLEGATVMSRAIYDTSGNIYKVGISKDVMYGAAGTSNDWSHGVAGIPYCYLLELRSKKHRFRLPKSEIEETGNEIFNSVSALMKFVDNYTPPEVGANNSTDDSDYSDDIASLDSQVITKA